MDTPLKPILVADLFPDISRRLMELLRSLTPEEWHLPTLSSRRNVKDIASHLLDGSLRRLSMQRDGYFAPDKSGRQGEKESIIGFLNRLSDEWEVGTRRLSPQVLVGLIEWADVQLAALFASLDPFAPAIFPVAWAGEAQSQNWMDVARDYTEKWHHTQQIFEATGHQSKITQRRLMHPCLNIFMRALPFTFHHVEAQVGSVVVVSITGQAGGSWAIEKLASGWQQMAEAPNRPNATVTMDQDIAWKLLTKRRGREAAQRQFPMIFITGDESLGSHVFDMVSVMA
ncbi:MAG: maleylpyruvate isomerase N-terminal domain-containing protein [Planctomycetia bacterium]|nr:maleylpyruvate isomerase N-terminal domain-containing protein [Planctomycetia bacterium]